MSVTPNFSWPLIEPTDFVTNLPADLETLADDIDADVWAIKGTADAAISKTIVDAAGDLIYGTANDTVTRLGIGTAGQVLTVNSGATAPQWGTLSADSITLLSQTTLSGSSVTVSNINQTYRELIIIVDSPRWDTSNDRLQIRLNNSSSNAHMAGVTEDGTNTFTANGITGGSIESGAGDQDRSAGDCIYYLRVANYTATGSGGVGGLKPLHFYGSLVVSDQRSFNRAGAFVSASAITSVVVQTASSRNFQATNPGTLFIYGVK